MDEKRTNDANDAPNPQQDNQGDKQAKAQSQQQERQPRGQNPQQHPERQPRQPHQQDQQSRKQDSQKPESQRQDAQKQESQKQDSQKQESQKPESQQPQQPRQPRQQSQQGKIVPPKSPKKPHYSRYRGKNYSSSYNRPSAAPAAEASPKKTSFKKISIVVPLYNEEESLRPLANEIKKAMRLISAEYEVIFVDDGSTDKSLAVLKEISRIDPKYKYISFRKNYGKSAALQMGFKQVTGDVVITMDADLQDDPNEIPNLVGKLEEGYDLVSGWKKQRFDPFIKRHSSKFFNYVTGLMSGIKIHDFNCGLKAYRRDVVKNLNVYGELHRYMPVLSAWQGFTVAEIPVKHHPRRYGKTKFGISRFFKGFIDLLTVMFTTRYIKRPMHLFGFLGAIAFLIGFVVNGYLSVEWMLGHSLSNRPLLFFGMLLIIVGVQFFSVGLLGEMIVHSMMNDREYSIKDKS
ncbi:MAG TPA: glycosyltransferase [Ignavibacteriales bacterium]|nr:glycosyltransferase [Ignavibacteriales bacterium]